MRPVLLAALLVAAVLAGCSSSSHSAAPAGPAAPAGFGSLPKAQLPAFSAPLLLDDVRAGGEPVIAVTHAGTILVSSHPGFTHYFQSPDTAHVPTELAQDYSGQVYMWRSTDHGKTWTPVGPPVNIPAGPAGVGPRSTGFGVSDPDFTVMEDGTICYTDLEALAAASVSCSSDDGVTWLPGNAVASGAPVDRQWLASYKGELYFTANYLGGGLNSGDFRVSTDKAVTWTYRGTSPCNGDVVARPSDGHLFQGCGGNAITVSKDGARTWTKPLGPKDADGAKAGLSLNEPAVDGAGNVWTAWSDGERTLHVAGSPDEGATWPWEYNLTAPFRAFAGTDASAAGQDPSATAGTFVWPWVSAGSAGRLAVTWFGTYGFAPSEQNPGPWYVFTAFVVNATSATPTVAVERLTPQPMHQGAICQGGTGCETGAVRGDPSQDRRLGDLFETTVEPATGQLLGVWSNTVARPTDVVGHPQFVRQTGGIPLVAPEDLGKVVPTQG